MKSRLIKFGLLFNKCKYNGKLWEKLLIIFIRATILNVIKGEFPMNIKKENIKYMTKKALHISKNLALSSKEKANTLFSNIKVLVHNSKVWIENKWNKRDLSFLRNVHFNFHHLTTLCTVSLLAFFITLYATGANTSKASAFEMVNIQKVSLNEKAIHVSYGDSDALANIAKDILGNKVSTISEPLLLSSALNSYTYSIGDYVANITIKEGNKLGNVQAEIRVETNSSYTNKNANSVEVFSEDKHAKIEDGMICVYTVDLNIVDDVAPIISLQQNEVSLKESDTFDASKYLASINDNFEGMLVSYTVEGNVPNVDGKLKLGEYTITYRSLDTSNNQGVASLKVIVSEDENKEEEKDVKPAFSLQADSPYSGSIVSEARRLIGSAYVYGANGPSAFDCSGFVQYVYSRAGISVPRTSGAQSTFGNAINPNDMSQWRAGDIITFGAGGNEHAAIYSGSGTLIHALNPIQGVLETGVFGSVYAVRRP